MGSTKTSLKTTTAGIFSGRASDPVFSKGSILYQNINTGMYAEYISEKVERKSRFLNNC